MSFFCTALSSFISPLITLLTLPPLSLPLSHLPSNFSSTPSSLSLSLSHPRSSHLLRHTIPAHIPLIAHTPLVPSSPIHLLVALLRPSITSAILGNPCTFSLMLPVLHLINLSVHLQCRVRGLASQINKDG